MTKQRRPHGFGLLGNRVLNKGTAFTLAEREEHGLRGLLPATVCSQEIQVMRVLENMRRKAYDIERYIFLSSLQARNERLFFRLVLENIEEIMPLIYTPTVGQACKEYAHIFRQPKGFYISPVDRGHIRRMLDNWAEKDIRVIVITDGERILGLGDLGANGMGIPVGKLSLYTACAGIPPHHCLPVMLDVGTDNEELREDPLYLGVAEPRLRGDAYLELMDEFVAAVNDAYPQALIQFEDFTTPNAYRLLRRYQDKTLCFNDDIQGTAGVVLAGVIAATRICGTAFRDLRIMFLGAGSAATGIGDLIARALQEEGLDAQEARKRLWFVDSQGLVVRKRTDLAEHKLPWAQDYPRRGLIEAIQEIKPHMLIGTTAHPHTFTEAAVRLMAEINQRPALFALSNPTSKAECTAEQAYQWSDGRAIFASGSPFDPVEYEGRTFRPGQGNNAYIFPGVGLGVVVSGARRVTNEMFLAAAHTLAHLVHKHDLRDGCLYPPLTEIREVSAEIAVAVAETAYAQGLAQEPRPDDLAKRVRGLQYDPTY